MIAEIAAPMIAFFVFVWQIQINRLDRKYQKSEFLLKSALEAFEESSKLLEDRNNNRVTWIAAARAVERGQRIASGITEQEHKDLLDVQLDRYRRIFGRYLGFDDQEISGSFFYGVEPSMEIDAAATQSTEKTHSSSLQKIPESALRIIFLFAQFPKDHADPISIDTRFPDSELESEFLSFFYPGLFKYLQHIRKYTSINGTLVENAKNKVEISSNQTGMSRSCGGSDMEKLNGWQRLWIVVSLCGGLAVIVFGIWQFIPEYSEASLIRDDERAYLEGRPRPSDAHSFTLPLKALLEDDAVLAKRLAEKSLQDSQKKITEAEKNLFWLICLAWLLPSIMLYVLGWLIAWVIKGFRKDKNLRYLGSSQKTENKAR